jgi:hypothetical protein
MVRTGKILAYSLFFVLALMYLIPKTGIYYFFEEQIRPYSIVINDETVQDSGLGLEITDATVFIKSIESAQVGSIEVDLFALFNAIDITDVTLSSVAEALIPVHVQEVHFRHSILHPMQIKVDGKAEAGVFHATFHILDRVLSMNLKPSENMLKNYKSTLSNLKRSENGEYVYEKSI